MTSKESILQSIRQFKRSDSPKLPDFNQFIPTSYEDLLTQFDFSLQSVGGEVGKIKSDEGLDQAILRLFPDAKKIASNFSGCQVANIDANAISDPHGLASLDLAIVKGEFGVAENGAVWIKNPTNRHRVLYFLAQNLVIVVPENEIVATMHEAYQRISFKKRGFGVFVSGPSKTADIEQSLVIGAHGPKSGIVFFI